MVLCGVSSSPPPPVVRNSEFRFYFFKLQEVLQVVQEKVCVMQIFEQIEVWELRGN